MAPGSEAMQASVSDVEPRNSFDSLTETAGAKCAVYSELSCLLVSARMSAYVGG